MAPKKQQQQQPKEEEEEAPARRTSTRMKAAAASAKEEKKLAPAAASRKRVKQEEEEEEEQPVVPKKKAAAAAPTKKQAKEEEQPVVKTKAPAPSPSATIPVDAYYPRAGSSSSCSVWQDYDAMLNQTNLGQNNNKFYKLQVISHGTPSAPTEWVCFTRWGRVGEPGASQAPSFSSPEQAIAAFSAKFRDKTKNAWGTARDAFVKHQGKYQLLAMDYSQQKSNKGEEEEEEEETATVAPSVLAQATQWLVRLVFDKQMFNESMQHLKVDTTRLPLGALSKQQIQEGNRVLADIMAELDKNKPNARVLQELSSQYYTLIPTAVGRSVPPTLNTAELVQQKFDLLAVLADIERATEMMTSNKTKTKAAAPTVLKPNPVDALYATLDAQLTYVDPKGGDEFDRIALYAAQTQPQRRLLHVWRVRRNGDDSSSSFHPELTNRKLLWHGTNAAVVAAIIKSGLRIMPHSGGRVGRGIYLADQLSKSSGYVWPANDKQQQGGRGGGRRVGMLFLAEAALGDEHHITEDDPSLRQAPKGAHSVVALGTQAPDVKADVEIELDGRKVIIPLGKSKANHRTPAASSSFTQNEFLVYRESQHRLRYMLAFEW